MNRCPITYEFCDGRKYSEKGIKLLSPKLKELHDFPFTAKQQRDLAVQQASKISLQGVQSKLIVKLNVAHGMFEIVDRGGTFIFKPPHLLFDELPQNEDLTMRLAQLVGLEVPVHGMIYNQDGSLTYFIRRFDRLPGGHKVSVEDFSQLVGFSRDTKYESSMEKLVSVIEQFCTFPLLEKIKLFRLTLFNFLVGNEDAHLKNFSMIRRQGKVQLSPVYDLVNSSIVMKAQEEIALPLRGKKSKLSRADLVDYFGKERLKLSHEIVDKEIQRFKEANASWDDLISRSFLSLEYQKKYLSLLRERQARLGF
ncbi:MAG: HipA domain-containing protein [Rhabdochlamydiaceae bacterium]|jgi:serine/threonine-protein kinase HipA